MGETSGLRPNWNIGKMEYWNIQWSVANGQ